MTLPVTLDDAKRQLRGEGIEQDAEISDFILDAAGWVENYTSLILEAREVQEQFRAAGRSVELKAWPILPSATAEVTYIDASGIAVPVAGVRLDASKRPARIYPASGTAWPTTNPGQVFTVTVRAGFEDPADVPRVVRRAMLLLIGAYDDDREGGDTIAKAETAARSLCRKLRRATL